MQRDIFCVHKPGFLMLGHICNVNGCQCPVGTVIDWNKTECVLPRECEGIQYMCSYSQII